MHGKPNILFLIVDELRYPVSYESIQLQEWKKKYLKFYNLLSERGTVFHRHYTNTNACVPSRVTLQTGHYPSVHGCDQTDSVAKEATDPGMNWFPKFKIPTIGNYLEEDGYQCHLRGKWHLSLMDIVSLSGIPLLTYDSNGFRIKENEKKYQKENVLKDYGYNGWIGPEPHGVFALNSASSTPSHMIGRDEKFVEQTCELLDELDQKKDPWYACINLVDPHDITLYGTYFNNIPNSFEFELDPTLPDPMFKSSSKKTFNENLETKPPCQTDYRDKYYQALQPIVKTYDYIKYYYTLMRRVDEQLMKIWNKLTTLDCYKNTIIIFTSDHGDLLASHGGMYQKWYQAYDESIRVPLVISSPLFGNKRQDIYNLTSHIDILPTFLDICSINRRTVERKLCNKFNDIFPLHGLSLLPLVKGYNTGSTYNRPVYFYTEDDAFRGENQVSAFGNSYEPPQNPSSVEAIITYKDGKLWKLTNYYAKNNVFTPLDNTPKNELYNITDDPMELNNLYNNADSSIKNYMKALLYQYSVNYKKLRNFI